METINGTIDVAGRGRSRVTLSYMVCSPIVRVVEYTPHSVPLCAINRGLAFRLDTVFFDAAGIAQNYLILYTKRYVVQ